jgi:hypothetical protein
LFTLAALVDTQITRNQTYLLRASNVVCKKTSERAFYMNCVERPRFTQENQQNQLVEHARFDDRAGLFKQLITHCNQRLMRYC